VSGVALDLLLQAIPVGFVMFVVLNFGGLLTWVERKQSAIMQDRLGANRASIFGIRVLGLLHPLADASPETAAAHGLPARARVVVRRAGLRPGELADAHQVGVPIREEGEQRRAREAEAGHVDQRGHLVLSAAAAS